MQDHHLRYYPSPRPTGWPNDIVPEGRGRNESNPECPQELVEALRAGRALGMRACGREIQLREDVGSVLGLRVGAAKEVGQLDDALELPFPHQPLEAVEFGSVLEHLSLVQALGVRQEPC